MNDWSKGMKGTLARVVVRQVGQDLERRCAEPLDAVPAPGIDVGQWCLSLALRSAEGDRARAPVDERGDRRVGGDAAVPAVRAADRVEVTGQAYRHGQRRSAADDFGRTVVPVVLHSNPAFRAAAAGLFARALTGAPCSCRRFWMDLRCTRGAGWSSPRALDVFDVHDEFSGAGRLPGTRRPSTGLSAIERRTV